MADWNLCLGWRDGSVYRVPRSLLERPDIDEPVVHECRGVFEETVYLPCRVRRMSGLGWVVVEYLQNAADDGDDLPSDALDRAPRALILQFADFDWERQPAVVVYRWDRPAIRPLEAGAGVDPDEGLRRCDEEEVYAVWQLA